MASSAEPSQIVCHTTKAIAKRRVVSLREPLLRERLVAEFVGTFFLTLTVGVSVAGGGPMAAIAIGLVLGIQIYTFGPVSGGFFNPAVVLAVLLSGRGKISPKDAGVYSAVEVLGGLLGSIIAYAVSEKSFCFDHSLSHSAGTSFVLETFFTMALCSTVLATGTSNDAPNQYFGFAIGLTVTGGALASGGFDQGSFNPAVTLAFNIANWINPNATQVPSVVAWLIFLFAPLLGGALAAGVFYGTRGNEFEVMEDVGTGPAPQVTESA